MSVKDLAYQIKELRLALGLTQLEMSERLGIKRTRYANFELGISVPNQQLLHRLRALGLGSEVGPPLIPASQLEVPVPYIGHVAASNKVDWTDPFETETFEYVPAEMGEARGRFACRITSDSMMPLLEPGDLCVFQKSELPTIGLIILFRSTENSVTVKQLKHDGETYRLCPLNPTYSEEKAEGTNLGFLVGIVRERGTLRTTIYDKSGIRA